jgi:proteasome lid subunit RPN8/RPN11
VELRIQQTAVEEIHRHAVEAYPNECCGVVLAEEGGHRVRRIDNIQNRLHAEDPARHPRDARIAYYMEPKQLYEILTEAERRGSEILAFYHSHPEHAAYFSEEDRARAMAWDEPAYPQAFYLVVSVVGRSVRDQIAVGWDPQRLEFVPANVSIDC